MDFERICNSLGKQMNDTLIFNTSRDIKEIYPFLKELEEWAEDYYINVDWVIDSVLYTFFTWYQNDEMRDIAIFYPNMEKIKRIAKNIFPEKIEIQGFNFLIDTEYHYKKAAKDIVDSHVKAAKAVAEEIGFIKAKEKRTDSHYKWFINHHVFGMTYEEIAEELSVEDLGKIKAQINGLYNVLGFRKQKN